MKKEDKKNTIPPSKVLLKIFILPYFFPKRAAKESEKAKIKNPIN